MLSVSGSIRPTKSRWPDSEGVAQTSFSRVRWRVLPIASWLLCACGLSACLFVLPAAAANIVSTGSFLQDDNQKEFDFTLNTPATVIVQTWSFAGGTNANGQVIPAGGFAPVLTLFLDPTGFLPPAVDTGGTAPSGCGPRIIDPVSGFCLDGYLNENLGPGSCALLLTEYDNLPLGNTPADGFSEAGNGNFTGGPFLLNAGPGYQRTGNWAVDVIIAPASSAPEPATGGLMWLSATVLAAARLLRKRQARKQTA
jgi:hypothetical protein